MAQHKIDKLIKINKTNCTTKLACSKDSIGPIETPTLVEVRGGAANENCANISVEIKVAKRRLLKRNWLLFFMHKIVNRNRSRGKIKTLSVIMLFAAACGAGCVHKSVTEKANDALREPASSSQPPHLRFGDRPNSRQALRRPTGLTTVRSVAHLCSYATAERCACRLFRCCRPARAQNVKTNHPA